jgi:periplasmic copper chaperone A
MIERTVLVLFAVLVCAFGAETAQAPAFTVSAAWVRESVPGRPQTAAYAVVENGGAAELRIVSASSDAAGAVELHEMVRTGDMMRMAPVKSIAVPAKGRVELKPGGLHIMLFQLKKPLEDGDTVDLTLTTDTGAKVRTLVPVKKGQMP